MHVLHRALPLLMFVASVASAQPVVHNDENLSSDRPEAWAMNDVAASTLLTAFGETPDLASGHLDFTLELSVVPRLSDAEQHVGFNGFKKEDLNRSPLFGRARLHAGLPGGWVGELAYTPPIAIHGTRPRDLVAVAFGHRLFERENRTLSIRAFGQHGAAEGDITCPGRLAGVADRDQNPSGCQGPSDDRISLDYYGADVIASWGAGAWRWHVDLGAVRTELAVQVDAPVLDVRDRSRLIARGVLPWLALGATYRIGGGWNAGIEGLYVPLFVKREAGGSRTSDPFVTVRFQLGYRID